MWEAFEGQVRPAPGVGQGGGPAWALAELEAALPPPWRQRLAATRVAFQPIVNIHTGAVFGFECLLRGWREGGWASIAQLMDEAHGEGLLLAVGQYLRGKALATLHGAPLPFRPRLFFNVDNREIDHWPGLAEGIATLLASFGLPPESVCLEVSEKQPTSAFDSPLHTLARVGTRAHKVAIDDFGTGFSGLKLLYLAEPDFIKIDRFFIAGLAADARKRLFVSSIVHIAHTLGTLVIAEGVETLAEYRECRAVGCDLVQGFFVQPPVEEVTQLRQEYAAVLAASRGERRNISRDRSLVISRVEPIPAISVDMEMSEVLQFFRRESTMTFVPVVNQHGEPLGIVRESDLREYAYSTYGKDLLKNPSLRAILPRFIVPCPVADVHMSAERILELFSQAGGQEGVLVVDNSAYVGFLSAPSLLQVINEKNLLLARDQNPLTRLPGNTLIYEALSTALRSGDTDRTAVYFDFNNFKPFNDTYGFRAGDRAIMLFAEVLQKLMLRGGTFLGHVGGDDFFALVQGAAPSDVISQVSAVLSTFARDVSSLYRESDRERGYMEATDRAGRRRRFPLLTASAAVLFIPAGPPRGHLDDVVSALAAMKRTAKGAAGGLCYGVLDAEGRVALGSP